MRILLDENLPHDLRHFLTGHEGVTVAYMGWKGLENGALLSEAAKAGFDVLLDLDAGMEYTRNPRHLPITVLVLSARSNALDDLRPLVPALLRALVTVQPRTLNRVG